MNYTDVIKEVDAAMWARWEGNRYKSALNLPRKTIARGLMALAIQQFEMCGHTDEEMLTEFKLIKHDIHNIPTEAIKAWRLNGKWPKIKRDRYDPFVKKIRDTLADFSSAGDVVELIEALTTLLDAEQS